MCNPIWTLVRAEAVLIVAVAPEGNPGVTGSILTTGADGESTKQPIQSRDFPLRLPIRPGTSYIVRIQAVSLGDEAYLTVTSRVEGGDPRGPDRCRLEVDENHPLAITTIIASGA